LRFTNFLVAESWEFDEYKCPQQADGTSCGLFTAINAVHICRRAVPSYKVDANSVNQLRQHVFNEMKTGNLAPLSPSLLRIRRNQTRK